MQKKLLTCTLLLLASNLHAQTGNRVVAGAEAANFGTISLSTSQIWLTARSSTPGYFSNVGTATLVGATDLNNVNGYVKHYASASNQAFTFPVGTGIDLRTIAVSGNRPSNSVIATAWILGDPTTTLDPTDGTFHPINSFDVTADSIANVSNIGMWDWQDISDNADGTTITVSIPELVNFGTATSVRLVGWNGTQWVKLGNTGVSATTEGNLLTGTAIDNISAIGIGSIEPSSVLSNNSIKLTAQPKNCEVVLNWTIENNQDLNQINIEFSTDGKLFRKIGTVSANGLNYTFTHKNTNHSGEHFYRINLLSNNGDHYSNVQKATLNCNNDEIQVYPNPASDKIIIAGLKEQHLVQIVNQLGQTVWQQKGTANYNAIDVKNLNTGNYNLIILDGQNNILTQKLTIIK